DGVAGAFGPGFELLTLCVGCLGVGRYAHINSNVFRLRHWPGPLCKRGASAYPASPVFPLLCGPVHDRVFCISPYLDRLRSAMRPRASPRQPKWRGVGVAARLSRLPFPTASVCLSSGWQKIATSSGGCQYAAPCWLQWLRCISIVGLDGPGL